MYNIEVNSYSLRNLSRLRNGFSPDQSLSMLKVFSNTEQNLYLVIICGGVPLWAGDGVASASSRYLCKVFRMRTFEVVVVIVQSLKNHSTGAVLSLDLVC